MPAEALAPAVDAVVFGDTTGHDEFVVARHADVVVTCVAFEAVIAGVGRRNGVAADVAEGSECKGPEGEVGDGEEDGSAHEGGGFGRERGGGGVVVVVGWGEGVGRVVGCCR